MDPFCCRCLREPLIGGNGSVVLFDTVLNLQSGQLFLLGPHKKVQLSSLSTCSHSMQLPLKLVRRIPTHVVLPLLNPAQLWIVPETPELQARTVLWADNYGEGREFHWLGRIEAAATRLAPPSPCSTRPLAVVELVRWGETRPDRVKASVCPAPPGVSFR
jgi:hypothetical protein